MTVFLLIHNKLFVFTCVTTKMRWSSDYNIAVSQLRHSKREKRGRFGKMGIFDVHSVSNIAITYSCHCATNKKPLRVSKTDDALSSN